VTDEPKRAPEASHPSWADLLTESRHPESARLDRQPTEVVVGLLLAEDRAGIEAAERRSEEIAAGAEMLAKALGAGGDVIFVGAGTSGRLGVLEAAECPPTFGTEPRRIRAVMAGGDEAIFKAREGAEDRADDGADAMREVRPEDVVVAISASSVTPFARGALEAARQRGAATILLTCARPGGLEGIADLLVALETGPEILTGSTRLKAGSATKAALNALTTGAMVRLGKVYENLMVDLRTGSAKLRDRAVRILAAAADLEHEAAERALADAGGEVKTAIVMARLGLDADAARARVRDAGEMLWRALDEAEHD